MAKRGAKKQTEQQSRPTPVKAGTSEIVSQPSVRQSSFWTPDLLRTMQIYSDSGDMFRLGDLCEQLMADDRIGEHLESLASDVLGSDLTFELGPRSNTGSAEKADELDVDWASGFDDDELASLITWTMVLGFCWAKIETWVETEDGRIMPRCKWWHPKHFSYKYSPEPALRTWQVRDSIGTLTPIKSGDGTWVMFTKRGESRPWANGLWRGLAKWWLLKQYAISDYGVHSEKASKLIISCTPGNMSEDRRLLARDIYEASKNAVIALPEGFDLKLVELSASTEKIYSTQVDMANTAFSIAILGQNLSTQVDTGSLAATQKHAQKENRKVRYVAMLLGKVLWTQLLPYWAEYNFGDRTLAPFPKWHTEPPEDFSAKATTLKATADGLVALKAAGYKLTPEQIEEEYGLEVEELPEPEPPPIAAPVVVSKPVAVPAPVKKPKTASATRTMLSSGASSDEAPGFVAGQVYADALSDKETALAADYLSAFVDRIAVAIDGAEDYESIRGAVLTAFADEEDPERLVELVEHGILLANLAGRHAVDEDAS
jgi:phage gp29-like protein